MDFKSLMSAQISKSKPKSANEAPASKYVRRADLEASRRAQYAAEQEQLDREREERLSKKRKLEEEEEEKARLREEKKRKLAEESKARREEDEAREERARRKRLGLPELPDTGDQEDAPLAEGEVDVAEQDLVRKLRALQEPAVLFGESHAARLRRYNGLMQKALTPQLSNTPIPTSIPLLSEADMAVPSTLPAPSDVPALTHLYAQLASYFTLLLTEWRTSLSLRSPGTKSSTLGAQATRTYTTVLTDLTPLFRLFESQSLAPTLLQPITAIVHEAQRRRYVKANDLYLQLSIGKAAWPIGVTMVGIHERSAREKLHGGEGGKEAHILADEVTRKYLQSIKRCLSFAQTRWPPEDLGQLMG